MAKLDPLQVSVSYRLGRSRSIALGTGVGYWIAVLWPERLGLAIAGAVIIASVVALELWDLRRRRRQLAGTRITLEAVDNTKRAIGEALAAAERLQSAVEARSVRGLTPYAALAQLEADGHIRQVGLNQWVLTEQAPLPGQGGDGR